MRAGLIFLALLLPLLGACSETARVPPKPLHPTAEVSQLKLSPQELSKIDLSTALVETRNLPMEITVPGQVDANAELTTPVLSLVGGRLKDVAKHLGDTVRAGELVACVESDDVAQLESDLLSKVLDIESDIQQDLVEMKLCRAAYDRKKLLVDEKIAAKADLESAIHDLEKSEAALTASRGKRTAAIKSASERLKLFGVTDGEVNRLLRTNSVNNIVYIKAPRAGTIISRQANPGQQIDNSTPLFTISDLNNVWLVAQVFEQNVAAMRLGLPVTVTLDSYPNELFNGKIDYIGPKIDLDTRTLPVRASVANIKHLLKPQMFARMTLKTGDEKVLAVPCDAVQRTGDLDIVYVQVGPSSFEERRVKTGDSLGGYTQILSGLKVGEKVVVKGSLQLQGEAIQRIGQ